MDEAGELLFQAVRYEPKDFRQRQRSGRGGWTWNLGDTRRVLYQLPELLKAPADHPVYIVEGEKDVDRLAGLGLVATTCPMGASKWEYVEDEPLAGRKVIILPDNDEAGLNLARKVAEALHGRAVEVRVLELPGLPDHADVTLWDISNPATSQLRSTINRTTLGIEAHSPHNPIIVENRFLFVSWFLQAGLQVLDISDPAHVAAFDTDIGNLRAGFRGNWGVYPLLGPDRILLSDTHKGLFVVDVTAAVPEPSTCAVL